MNHIGVVAVVGFLTLTGTLGAQGTTPVQRVPGLPPAIVTTHQRVSASLERIAKGSGLWREEIEVLRGTGRQAVVLTPEQVVVIDRGIAGASRTFDRSVLAEVSPVVTGPSSISTVLVVVNLPLLERIHSRRGSLPAEHDADLDAILVHEVYGHAFPYLLAGETSGRCADPVPGERPQDACSIARENAVRAELGLGRRTGYGLNGLLLSLESEYPGFNAGLALSIRRPH